MLLTKNLLKRMMELPMPKPVLKGSMMLLERPKPKSKAPLSTHGKHRPELSKRRKRKKRSRANGTSI